MSILFNCHTFKYLNITIHHECGFIDKKTHDHFLKPNKGIFFNRQIKTRPLYTKYYYRFKQITNYQFIARVLQSYGHLIKNHLSKYLMHSLFIYLLTPRQTDPVFERSNIHEIFNVFYVLTPLVNSHDLKLTSNVGISIPDLLIHVQQWRHLPHLSPVASSSIFFCVSQPNHHIFFSSQQTILVSIFFAHYCQKFMFSPLTLFM